jgi:hypothetical protein
MVFVSYVSDFTIRAATERDIDPVLCLWDVAGGPPSVTDTRDGLVGLLASDGGALLVAESDGAVVGSLIAAWDGWRGSFYRSFDQSARMPHSRDVNDPALTGGCLCGGVRFELTAPPLTAGYCHCTRCQRRTGTASSAQARIDGRTLRLLQGEELVKAWRHPEGGHEKLFCGECGAHLFSRSPEDQVQMSVRMGAFDGDPGIRPSWRSYVAYSDTWESIPDDGIEPFIEPKTRPALA